VPCHRQWHVHSQPQSQMSERHLELILQSWHHHIRSQRRQPACCCNSTNQQTWKSNHCNNTMRCYRGMKSWLPKICMGGHNVYMVSPNKRRAVAAQTVLSLCKVLSNPYSMFRPIILGLIKGKGLYMASESSLSCISPFLRHLRNQWSWISCRGHSRIYILSAMESPCTTLYRPLIVAFALSSTVLEILPV